MVPGDGHSKLLISSSHTIIDAAQAAQGVLLTIDYPHKQLYDEITISCGGVIFTIRLEPTPSNPNPDLSKPIVVTLTTPHFANDRNNPLFEIKYNVVSQLANSSGTTRLGKFDARDYWSSICFVDVRLDQVLLDQAILREDPIDSTDDPKVADLDKMNGGPLWALIYLPSLVWMAGDYIRLTFEAWLNGVLVGSYKVTLPIGPIPGLMTIDIPNKEVVPDSQLKVTYEQLRAGKVIAASEVAEAQVVGKKPPDGEVVDEQPFSESLGGWILYDGIDGIFEVQDGSKCLRLVGPWSTPALSKKLNFKPGQYRLSFETRNLGIHPSDVYAGLSSAPTKRACLDKWANYSFQFTAYGTLDIHIYWIRWNIQLGVAIRDLLLVRLPDTLENK